MTREQTLRASLDSVEADAAFTEAVMRFRDGSRLYFCHKVGERWMKAVGVDGRVEDTGTAGETLAAVTMFRLNAKHLDIAFIDGSRWDQPAEIRGDSIGGGRRDRARSVSNLHGASRNSTYWSGIPFESGTCAVRKASDSETASR